MLLSNFKEENVLKVIFKTSIIFYHIEFYIFLITFFQVIIKATYDLAPYHK